MNFLKKIFNLLFALFLLITSSYADTTYFSLKNYLNSETLQEVEAALNKTSAEDRLTLVLRIDSTSGNLKDVLTLSQNLYTAIQGNKIKLIVYIEKNALGPAAILPLLSEKVYASPFAVWGDISLDVEEMGINAMKSHVMSLINSERPDKSVLKAIASAMIDPNEIAVMDPTFKLISKDEVIDQQNILSGNGQTLILNTRQMLSLGLIEEILTNAQLEKKFLAKLVTIDTKENKLENSLQEHIKFNSEKNIIGYIAVNDRDSSISQSTWLYVKSALDYYKKTKPLFIILDLNTPGGEVFAAQNISNALKEIDQQHNIPVVAFIDDWAISAGAMLAYSCRYISTVENGSMGAAEPVIASQEGMQSASEKVNSAIRKDFGNRAKSFGRNADIAEAMVDKDIILVFRHGAIVRLDSKEQIKLKGANPDIIISNESKLLTLNGNEMIKYGVADILLKPEKKEQITKTERNEGKWSFKKELLSKNDFFSKIPNATVDAYQMDWKTAFFAFLATPTVAALLMLGLTVGFYLEFSSPGVGIPGTIAAVCLSLIILSNLSLEIASMLEVVFVLLGLGFIALELFIIPTGGLLGIVGVIFFIGGLFAVVLPNIGSIDFEIDTATFNAAGEAFFERLAFFSAALCLAVIIIMFLAKYLYPSFTRYNRFILKGGEQEASKGYISGEDPKLLPQPGSEGEALTTLRPSGKVYIDDNIYEALTDGSFIEKGEKIIVTKLDGSNLVVKTSSLDR